MSRLASRRWVCLGGTALLTGCGFQPVYMPTASNKAGPAQREMAAVNVPVIPERPGQLLRQALQRELRSDSGVPPAYDLRVVFAISGEGISIQNNNIATRIRMIGTASWRAGRTQPAADAADQRQRPLNGRAEHLQRAVFCRRP